MKIESFKLEMEKVYSDMYQDMLVISCTINDDSTYNCYYLDGVVPIYTVPEVIFNYLKTSVGEIASWVLKPCCGFDVPQKFLACITSKELYLADQLKYEHFDEMFFRQLIGWDSEFSYQIYIGDLTFKEMQDYMSAYDSRYKIADIGNNKIACINSEIYEQLQKHFLFENVSLVKYEFVGGNKNNKYRATFSDNNSFCVFENEYGFDADHKDVEEHYIKRIKEYLAR